MSGWSSASRTENHIVYWRRTRVVRSRLNTWLNRAATNDVNYLDMRRLAVQLFGEHQHHVGDADSPQAQQDILNAIRVPGLENDPEIKKWMNLRC